MAEFGELVIPEHPATFSRAIMVALAGLLDQEVALRDSLVPLNVLDPFAGVGTVHELAVDERPIITVGVELQPEWARASTSTICGDTLNVLANFPRPVFDVLVTSPCYGNRMADKHDAKDPCRPCAGEGTIERMATPAEVDAGCELGVAFDPCPKCKGSGLTTRNTYKHKLDAAGVKIVDSDTNASVMQWGQRYIEFHRAVWQACDRVLVPGALVLLNVKNHIRTVHGVERVQRVSEFHLSTWLRLGYIIERIVDIPTRGLAVGANSTVRTPAELIMCLRKPQGD